MHMAERLVRLPIILVVLMAGLLLVPGTQITPICRTRWYIR